MATKVYFSLLPYFFQSFLLTGIITELVTGISFSSTRLTFKPAPFCLLPSLGTDFAHTEKPYSSSSFRYMERVAPISQKPRLYITVPSPAVIKCSFVSGFVMPRCSFNPCWFSTVTLSRSPNQYFNGV